jgi:NlpC/P60 family putative phage cell wall peptidase
LAWLFSFVAAILNDKDNDSTRSQYYCRAAWAGTPYHHQASLKGVGCDCLGLIHGLWRELLGDEPEAMPAYTRDWGDVTGSEPLLAAARRNLVPIAPALARPGDILVFRMQAGVAKHAGILSTLPAAGLLERMTEELHDEPSRFIHAVEELGVTEVALTRWWHRRIDAAFAFPGVN